MVISVYANIPPYVALTKDVLLSFELPAGVRKFRVIVYGRALDNPADSGGIAVFDEDFGLVLNDNLEATLSLDEQHAFVTTLAQKTFGEFRDWLNQTAEVRHQLGANGEIPW